MPRSRRGSASGSSSRPTSPTRCTSTATTSAATSRRAIPRRSASGPRSPAASRSSSRAVSSRSPIWRSAREASAPRGGMRRCAGGAREGVGARVRRRQGPPRAGLALLLRRRDRARRLVRRARGLVAPSAPRAAGRRTAVAAVAPARRPLAGHADRARRGLARALRGRVDRGGRRPTRREREHRADVRLRPLLDRHARRRRAARQRVVGAQPLAGGRRRGALGLGADRRPLADAVSVSATPGTLARGRAPLRVRLARARLQRPVGSARDRRGDLDLQRGHVGRDGPVRPARVGRQRRGVQRLLRPARPHRTVRRAGDGRQARGRRPHAALRPRPRRADAGDYVFSSPRLAELLGTMMNLAGLVGAILVVALAYLGAIAAARAVARSRTDNLAAVFLLSLVPIAFVYVVAHYFSLFVLQGQVAIPLVSDPLGRGWDLFGTTDFRVNLRALTPRQIWYVQVVGLIVGHVCGLAVAHDRAVERWFGRTAIRTQYAMLALMVLYTVGGMWILSRP